MTDPVIAALTDVGAAALAAAIASGAPVLITHLAVGSAGGTPTGAETALGAEVARVAVGAADPDGATTIVTALFDRGVVDADQTIREFGLFDANDRLIFHGAVEGAATLGALTPLTAYALSIQISLSAAPDGAIQFVAPEAPAELLLLNRVTTLEHRADRAAAAAWRNLFLSQQVC